jgi:hypothetical protein
VLVTTQELRVNASHFQFYVRDEDPEGDPGAKEFWSPEALADHLAVDEDIVAIGTASYGMVRVRVEIHDSEPAVAGEWDHVTEAGLSVPSGVMHVAGCVDSFAAFEVQPGPYRVRCCHANRSAGVIGGEGGDWYLLQVWPGQGPARSVLRHMGASENG